MHSSMAQQTTQGVRSMPVNLLGCRRDVQLTRFRVTIDVTGAPELARTCGARQGRIELGLLRHPFAGNCGALTTVGV